MQLGLSFSMLLAALLVSVSLYGDSAEAVPTRRGAGMVTLPLKRIHQPRDDIHPQVFLQQHINRGLKRYARMTGRLGPSQRELEEKLRRRGVSDSDLPNRRRSKRFNRPAFGSLSEAQTGKAGKKKHGQAAGGAAAGAAGTAGAAGAAGSTGSGTVAGAGNTTSGSTGSSTVTGAGNATSGSTGSGTAAGAGNTGNKKHGHAAGGAAAGAAAGAAGAAGATGSGAVAGAGNATSGSTGSSTVAGAGNTTSGSNSTGSTGGGPGISQIDVQAAENGGLTNANAPTANNSLGLDIEANDVGYIATVQMGTPPADFKLLMDSGSADMWVASENCQSQGGGNCGNHSTLGTQSSSTFTDTGKQFEVTYGTGQVQGDVITDNVNVAGLALNNHSFGVANVESVDFSSDSVPFDGLMGLAQSTLSEEGVPTPVESMAQNGLISEAITSFKISRLADQLNDGEVTFGGLDSTKFNANTLTTFDNVNTEGFWEGAMDAVTVNGQDLGLQGRTAILDTGTTLIIAPDNDAAAVHQAIPGAQSDGQGGFTIPCTTNASVALTFGGQSFAIDTQDLLFSPVDPNNLQGDCVSGISSGQVGAATEWLLGDVFLKNAYFSVNTNKNQISLATLAS
ncbi:hypothetical protein AcV7_006503 [Taiwanofungus camphoratus]|nr:hypothetical protein AcV7_006503 [Antrodia cinnamomea]